MSDAYCRDCSGFSAEGLYPCPKHPSIMLCRGCQCPECLYEELDDEDGFDGPDDDCYLGPDGFCGAAGSEHCEWDCPNR